MFFNQTKSKLFIVLLFPVFAISCSNPIEWPESPLYSFNQIENQNSLETDIDSIKQMIAGHYAHYDVVSYIDTTTKSPMYTFVISYGFTDFFIDSLGNLIQSDRFIRASHKINQPHISSYFSDAATQAIKPRNHKVELELVNGKWHLYRPPTPSLLGIDGDASKTLNYNILNAKFTDPDNDGHPGVTVKITIAKLLKGEIYIARREIFSNHLILNRDGTITGYVKDESEQHVINASMKMLAQESNTFQNPDKGMNPVLLVPINTDIDTPEELFAIRDKIFPPEPEFK